MCPGEFGDLKVNFVVLRRSYEVNFGVPRGDLDVKFGVPKGAQEVNLVPWMLTLVCLEVPRR